jgi:hypothetical protein
MAMVDRLTQLWTWSIQFAARALYSPLQRAI